ncbi:Bro-N domain-containing protein [Sphingomonas sp. VDB2]|uniref:BRO-N domain-containing protein n=1 Tax=Sphingomonas sp. VDB2 TaxID=3228751 RepID=UPI003A7FE078
MTALIPLHFDQADVRMVMREGEPWWVLNDVCSTIGISGPRMAAARLFNWQKDYVWIPDAIGRQRKTLVVNEAGIYGLVIGSNKAEAERFAHWLFKDVLPSIRKYGSYPPPETTPSHTILEESPWEGIETKTVGQRFKQERLRWEADNARSFADVPSFSKRIIMAIEDDMGGATKGNRLHIMTVAGLDTLYILTGRRTMTEPERALRDTYRNAEPQRRQAMIAQIGATLQLGRSSADDVA